MLLREINFTEDLFSKLININNKCDALFPQKNYDPCHCARDKKETAIDAYMSNEKIEFS